MTDAPVARALNDALRLSAAFADQVDLDAPLSLFGSELELARSLRNDLMRLGERNTGAAVHGDAAELVVVLARARHILRTIAEQGHASPLDVHEAVEVADHVDLILEDFLVRCP
jgi:hypothetical protein